MYGLHGQAGIVGGAPELPLAILLSVSPFDFDPGWCRRNGERAGTKIASGCDVVGIRMPHLRKAVRASDARDPDCSGPAAKRVTRLHDHAFQASGCDGATPTAGEAAGSREGSRGLCNKNVWPAKWRPLSTVERSESIFRIRVDCVFEKRCTLGSVVSPRMARQR